MLYAAITENTTLPWSAPNIANIATIAKLINAPILHAHMADEASGRYKHRI